MPRFRKKAVNPVSRAKYGTIVTMYISKNSRSVGKALALASMDFGEVIDVSKTASNIHRKSILKIEFSSLL